MMEWSISFSKFHRIFFLFFLISFFFSVFLFLFIFLSSYPSLFRFVSLIHSFTLNRFSSHLFLFVLFFEAFDGKRYIFCFLSVLFLCVCVCVCLFLFNFSFCHQIAWTQRTESNGRHEHQEINKVDCTTFLSFAHRCISAGCCYQFG